MNRNLGKSAAALTIQYCILAFVCILPVGVSAQDDSAAGQPEVLLVAAGHCPPFVIQDKGEFTGSEILAKQKADGLATKLVGFEMLDKGPPPRPHYPIEIGAKVIGEIASGGVSPSLKKGIGMAYLPIEHSKPGTAIDIDIRGRKLKATIVKKPFYKK